MDIDKGEIFCGSSSLFTRVRKGIILKSLRPTVAERDPEKLIIERRILEILGGHPRIVGYQGFQDALDPIGLLFVEASQGNLQQYINQNHHSMTLPLRRKWCYQLTEAIHFIHLKGVIHSDLRPENCLVHASHISLDILICDFGGSMYSAQELDGKGLLDHLFWNKEWISTLNTDIYSLGSIFYTIITGYWFYKLAHTLDQNEDRWAYEERVEAAQRQSIYPNVGDINDGNIIQSCWGKQYLTAEAILHAR